MRKRVHRLTNIFSIIHCDTLLNETYEKVDAIHLPNRLRDTGCLNYFHTVNCDSMNIDRHGEMLLLSMRAT